MPTWKRTRRGKLRNNLGPDLVDCVRQAERVSYRKLSPFLHFLWEFRRLRNSADSDDFGIEDDESSCPDLEFSPA
jgi:hypothetical protein